MNTKIIFHLFFKSVNKCRGSLQGRTCGNGISRGSQNLQISTLFQMWGDGCRAQGPCGKWEDGLHTMFP